MAVKSDQTKIARRFHGRAVMQATVIKKKEKKTQPTCPTVEESAKRLQSPAKIASSLVPVTFTGRPMTG